MPSRYPNAIIFRAAHRADLPAANIVMAPFVARRELLPRTHQDLVRLLRHALVAEVDGRVVGFAALEIYSKKIAEIQCLSFEELAGQADFASGLVERCVDLARRQGVLEVMAVVPASLEKTLKACGFDFSLPRQKKALFIRPDGAGGAGETGAAPDEDSSPDQVKGVRLRAATRRDVVAIGEFIAPFVARGELLPRTAKELARLARRAFVAEAEGRLVGLAAMEIYSKKLSEIQCLSVAKGYRSQGIGKQLVAMCVQLAREQRVAETMAISSREEFLKACGFGYCLSGPKTVLFLRTRER
jgi:amino-acid N-acetyltransferase